MNDYYEVRVDIKPCNEDATDCMAYLLAEVGFESFVPDSEGLSAYVQAKLFDQTALNSAIESFPFSGKISVSKKFVEGRDWNEEWERNFFQPITVDDRVVVHSSFHTDIPETEYRIVIDPKMAFGTGHHATTTLMIRRILAADLKGKYVIDMGTGTGILAILAAMRGAQRVTAIEIDEFACVNAKENLQLNDVETVVDLQLGDAAKLEGLTGASLFLANINRNVITGDISAYAKTLAPEGTMLLSGFYKEDVPIIVEAAEKCGLKHVDTIDLDNWACVKLIKCAQ